MLRLVLALVGLLATSSGCITGPPHHDEPGFYVGVGGGFSDERFDMDSGITVTGSPSLNVRGGYNINSYFAVELDWDYFFEYSARFDGVGDRDLEGSAITANAKAFFHRGLIQPYAAVGLGVLYQETANARPLAGGGFRLRSSDETEMAFRVGGGVEIHDILHGIVEHLPVFLYLDGSYWLPTDDLMDYQFFLVSAGLAFKFGGHGHEADATDDGGEEAH